MRRSVSFPSLLAAAGACTGAAAVAAEARRLLAAGDAAGASEAVAEAVSEAAHGVGEAAGRVREELSGTDTALAAMIASLLVAGAASRTVAWGLRDRPRFGPFRNLRIGENHIHHYLPGMTLALASGGAGLLTESPRLRRALAVPFGAGLGMILDEAALLVRLEDVYWHPSGRHSVHATAGAAGVLGAWSLLRRR